MLMSDRSHRIVHKAFAALLIILGLDTGALFAIFSYVSVSQLSSEVGLVLFLMSALLLFFGYAAGIMVAGFLAIFVLTRFWNRTKRSSSAR